MKLYLVRHGETDANRILGHSVSGPMHNEPVTFELGGDTNVPLNVYGRTHAWDAGGRLPDHFDTVFVSPLLRTKETAEIIMEMKNADPERIIFRDELIEYRHGKFDGMSREQIVASSGGKSWGSAELCDYDYTPWGGDKWETIYDRMQKFYQELHEEHADETVICVTSAGIIRMSYKIFFSDKSPTLTRNVMIRNGSVHEFLL